DAEHDVNHALFDYRTETTCPCPSFDGEFTDCIECILIELKFDVVNLKHLLILFDKRIFRLCQNGVQCFNIKFLKIADDRYTADKLRNQTVALEVIRTHTAHDCIFIVEFLARCTTEADDLLTNPSLDYFIHAVKCTADDEQDVGCVYLYRLLVRMLSSALRRHAGSRTFEDFEQCLLHAFTRYISCD